MKNYLGIVLVLGTLAPISAMNNNNSRRSNARRDARDAVQVARPKKDQGNFIEKYVDMGDLIISLGHLYKRKKTDAASLTIALLEALQIGQLPLMLESGRETVLEEFFEPEELKKCLVEFLNRWSDGKFKKRHIADALEGLQDSLKMNAIKEEFGNHEWIDIKRTLDTLIAYYGGGEANGIEDAIDLEKLPKFFGLLLKDYFIIDVLSDALNKALQGNALTKSALLDCLNIEEIASKNGYDEVPNADGIRETIELFLALMEDDKAALFQVFEILGHYHATKNVEDESNDHSEERRPGRRDAVRRGARPAVRSHARGPQLFRRRARANQEVADEALSRRLQRDRNNNDDNDDNSSEEDKRPGRRPAQRPQVAQRSRAQDRAAQEATDEAFARRLQRELNQQ
jgi:hypothetical protein